MATEVSDTPITPDKRESIIVPTLVDTPSKPSSIQELVTELLSVLEKQEAELFSISCSDVNEAAQGPLSRAKAGNKEALGKLTEVMAALKHIPLDITNSYSPRNSPDISLNESLSLSPIRKVSESKISPPGSPSKYFHTLSFTKHQKRSSFSGVLSKSIDHSNSSDDSMDKSNPLSISTDISARSARPKKERRSITQFLTMKPQRSATMSHSSSTPSLNTIVRADVVPITPPPVSLDIHDRRSASLPASPVPPYKLKEKLQPEEVYTLQIHETSRMLFEKKRMLMQQQPNVTDISA